MDCAFDVTVIGAGVVGLAIAAELASPRRELCVLERHDAFGRETSSRNSEVIHAGLYYEPGSLKARLCIAGRPLLYEICERHGIAHRRVGKLVVACDENETPGLERILENARRCGVDDLRMLPPAEIAQMEPNVRAVAALWSPSTGILDSHNLMLHFERTAKANGAIISYLSDVTGIRPLDGGYEIAFTDQGQPAAITTRLLINSAGLGAENIARLAGIDTAAAGYRVHFCKGEYFSLSGGKPLHHLVYPVPPSDGASVGLHVTPDLSGRLRLGPSAKYVDALDYDVDPANLEFFFRSAGRYLPFLRREFLAPDIAGIRPKLKGPRDPFRDFVIRHEADKGLPGLINLIGIESPGLTACASIARLVRRIVDEIVS